MTATVPGTTPPCCARPPWWIEGVFPIETVLPLEPEAYTVMQEGETWRVTIKHSGEVIYEGPGPVEVVGSPAPF